MELFHDQAITLRAVAFEERHRIVTALTRSHGRISAVARNSVQSRRFGAALELMAASVLEVSFRGESELGFLRSAELRRSYEGVRRSYARAAAASAMIEVSGRIAPEREPCEPLFLLLANGLAELEERDGDPGVALNLFLAKCLRWSGHEPRWLECVGCGVALSKLGAMARVRGSPERAGWLCAECGSDPRADQDRARVVWAAAERVPPAWTATETAGEAKVGAGSSRADGLTAAALAETAGGIEAPIREATRVAEERGLADSATRREVLGFLEDVLRFHLPGFDRTPIRSLRV